jgi:hypothetical protein
MGRDTLKWLKEAGPWSDADLHQLQDEPWHFTMPHIIGVLTKLSCRGKSLGLNPEAHALAHVSTGRSRHEEQESHVMGGFRGLSLPLPGYLGRRIIRLRCHQGRACRNDQISSAK